MNVYISVLCQAIPKHRYHNSGLADTYLKTVVCVCVCVFNNKMQVDMTGKPRVLCPRFLPAQIFPQRQIIKSDFPAFFSDVMPLWSGLIPGGCTKGSAAIWSVILQLWLKHRNFHLVEDASLSLTLSEYSQHMCSAEGDIKCNSPSRLY